MERKSQLGNFDKYFSAKDAVLESFQSEMNSIMNKYFDKQLQIRAETFETKMLNRELKREEEYKMKEDKLK